MNQDQTVNLVGKKVLLIVVEESEIKYNPIIMKGLISRVEDVKNCDVLCVDEFGSGHVVSCELVSESVVRSGKLKKGKWYAYVLQSNYDRVGVDLVKKALELRCLDGKALDKLFEKVAELFLEKSGNTPVNVYNLF